METRNATHPEDVKKYSTERLRKEFLINNLFTKEIKLIYSHEDRLIIGGVAPFTPIILECEETGSDYFLERREVGIINIGGSGLINVNNEEYVLDYRDGLYIGKGNKKVVFKSANKDNPAKFYFISTLAHKNYSNKFIKFNDIKVVEVGTTSECNKRKIHLYIAPNITESCQLTLGLTIIEPNNVWNTMPCHLHTRRTEVYLYYNLSNESIVFHLMGEISDTRHIIVKNEEAIISPNWSIHSGAGTTNYDFIWGMGGENKLTTDVKLQPSIILK
jgi:4-deoxy-L-threo-5-hexosulose-uronate ketol-isomerase